MLTAKRKLLSLVALLCLLTSTQSEARESDVARGLRFLQEADDQQALKAFQQALRSTQGPPSERARIHMYLGITHFNLLQQEAAKDQFRTAFSIAPELELPEDTSPVTTAFVAEIKAELAAEQVEAAETSLATPPPAADPAAERPDLVPAHARQDRPSVARRYWPAWVALGVGLAAGGAGLGLGVMSRAHQDDSEDPSLPYPEALAKHEEASDLALGANVLFGVAGAAAIAAGVFFYLGSQNDEHDAQVSAAILPLPRGALLQLRALRW